MNDEQMKCFKMIYDFIHDERQNCGNLISLIEARFPLFEGETSGIADLVGQELREIIREYLLARLGLGASAMDLMYVLDRFITEETGMSGQGTEGG